MEYYTDSGLLINRFIYRKNKSMYVDSCCFHLGQEYHVLFPKIEWIYKQWREYRLLNQGPINSWDKAYTDLLQNLPPDPTPPMITDLLPVTPHTQRQT